MNNLTELEVTNLMNGLKAMLSYQAQRQKDLLGKVGIEATAIDKGWGRIHYAIDQLSHLIEEVIEAKRLIKARKWWSDPKAIAYNTTQLQTKTPERTELIEELADVFIIWLNVLVYLGINAPEFIHVLTIKLEKNNPNNPKATIGNRS
jgi:NTP pyrophosphatase (non-canonical NTP hydrolase)